MTKRISRNRAAFYSLPMLNERSLKYTKDVSVRRPLSEDAYNTRSSIHMDPGHYTRFLIRSIMSSKKANYAIGKFLSGVANAAVRKVAERHPTTPVAAVKYHVLHSMYHGSASVDTVFGDLFRLLYGDADVEHLRTNTTVSEHVSSMTQEKSFRELLMPKCKGNVLLSVMTTLNILDAESTQNQFGKAASESVQDDKENEEEQQDESSSESSQSDQQQDDNENEEQQDGSGNGDSDESESSESNENQESNKGGNGDEHQDDDQTLLEEANSNKVNEVLTKSLADAEQQVEWSGDAPIDAINMAGDLAGDQFKEAIDNISQIGVVNSLLENMLAGGKAMKVNMQNVFDLVGRFRGVESEALTITSIGDGEIVDVVTGGDIERILPSEYLELANPETEMQFFAKLLEDGLLETERHGYDEAGFGPVIIMVDISGSMMGGFNFEGQYYLKQVMASAFAISMVRHCIDQKRDCLVVPFQTQADIHKHVIFSQYLRRSKSEVLADINNVCAMSGGGGTSFTKSLEAIPELLKQYPHIRFEQADVIFFSDGQGDCPDQASADALRDRALPPGSRIFGLFIFADMYHLSEVDRQERLQNLEHKNSILFDACVATSPDGLRDALKRLYRIVVEQGFYHVGEQQG